MTKRAQIVTFHWTVNYGGVLQAYALQETVKSFGLEAEFLNYYNDREIIGRMSAGRRLMHAVWTPAKNLLFGGKKREQLTDRFRSALMNIPDRRCGTLREAQEASAGIDVFITGSDQVWNADLTGNPDVYLLNHAGDGKRVAYAASFGKASLKESCHPAYREALNRFSAISVREDSGARIVREVSGRDAQIVVDPVFLLTREQWLAAAERSAVKRSGAYVLCYYMPAGREVTETIRRTADDLARQYGCEVVNIGKKEYEAAKFWEHNLTGVGPAEFVWLVSHAKAVVTNSFHGTAFSLIMNVPFAVPVKTDLPPEKRLSARIEWILKLVGAEDRMVPCGDGASQAERLSVCDFTEINRVLAEQIAASRSWLQAQLSDQ